jgi:hypothetical protein
MKHERLIRHMMWVACLSRGEAEACLRDAKAGREWSGEAVNHFGGTGAVIRAAVRTRKRAHKAWEATSTIQAA